MKLQIQEFVDTKKAIAEAIESSDNKIFGRYRETPENYLSMYLEFTDLSAKYQLYYIAIVQVALFNKPSTLSLILRSKNSNLFNKIFIKILQFKNNYIQWGKLYEEVESSMKEFPDLESLD